MNSFLLNRHIGSVSPQALASAQNNRLLRAVQAAPTVRFVLEDAQHNAESGATNVKSLAHAAGVNSIAIDKFEGRYLLSGGADSSLAIWDLDSGNTASDSGLVHKPIAHVAKSSTTQSFGVTQVSFYPFDSLAFLSSSYDHTLKLYSSETLTASATFDLSSVVYAHDCSPGLLVACASQHPAVRLIDLRSGASTHSLAGHSGAVLTVAWNPKNENLLASGATDGVVRLWDIRRSASSLGVLDMDDSIGIAGYDGRGTGARRRERGRAHNGPANGAAWTEDGHFLVTTGHDEKMRVWNMQTGANTLVNFGPAIKNAHTSSLPPLLAPASLAPPGKNVLYYPNPKEILAFDLHSGTLLSRLRAPSVAAPSSANSGVRNLKNRTTTLAWRAYDIELYSGHADGTIRCWRPRTWEDALVDREEGAEVEGNDEGSIERKRKRDELENIVKDLTNKRVTFS